MTSEASKKTPEVTVKQQENSEVSKDRIVLRKKPSLDQETPQHNGAQRGGSLNELFSALSVSDEVPSVEPVKKKFSRIDNSDFSDVEDAENIIPMPKPGIPEAPYFDGLDVEPFLNCMKSLAIKSGITGPQLASTLPSYCSPKIRTFIRESYVFRTRNWKSIKEFMIETYKNKEISKFKIKDLDYLVGKEWNYENSFSLINEFKVVARDLIRRKVIMEDVVVSKISKILPGSYIKAGLLAQGERSISNMFISLEDAVVFTQKCFTLLEKGKEFNQINQNIEKTYVQQQKVNDQRFVRLCVYCDKDWHYRSECTALTKDITSKKVKINQENQICFYDGKSISTNFGSGGMVALVDKSYSASLCTIDIPNSTNFTQIGGFDTTESEIEYSEHDIFMAKRKNDAAEFGTSKIQKTTKQDLLDNNEKQNKISKPPQSKLGLPKIDESMNSDLLEETLNLTIPVTIRQLITSNQEYRKQLAELIKMRRVSFDNKHTEIINPESEINLSQLMKASNIIKVDGSLCGFPVKFTFDTGSMLNLVNKEVIDKMKRQGISIQSGQASYHLKGIYGESVSTSIELPDCSIEIAGSESRAHLVVTDSDSFEVLLGMPWIRSVKLASKIKTDGIAEFTISSNLNKKEHSFEINIDDSADVPKNKLGINTLTLIKEFGINPYVGLSAESQTNYCNTLYKSVKRKIRPINTQIPEKYSKSPGIDTVIHKEEPSYDEMEKISINKDYLTPNEYKYFKTELFKLKGVFACSQSHMGCLNSNIEPPVKIHTVEHKPWNFRPIPIPHSMRDKVVSMIKSKVDSGILEPGTSAYANRWFTIKKKDGETLRFIQDMQPANAVTIKDGGLPPITEDFADSFSGRSIYSFDYKIKHIKGENNPVADILSRGNCIGKNNSDDDSEDEKKIIGTLITDEDKLNTTGPLPTKFIKYDMFNAIRNFLTDLTIPEGTPQFKNKFRKHQKKPPEVTVKQQENSEVSKDRIVLRKKPSLDQETPQHNGAQRGGSLNELFSALSVSDEVPSVEPVKKKFSRIDNSDFSDVEDAENIIPMPKPGIPEAPYFDGLDVEPFLNCMKSLAIKSGITGPQLASTLPSYCSPKIRTFIRESYVFRTRNWKSIKEFMIETYKNKEISKFKIKDLDYLVGKEWNYENSFSLINEFKVVARDLIRRKVIMEDVVVSKISKILPGSYIKAGLLAQGERSISNMF
ncbi:hypothetical protein AYI69_g7519, partial [Smittium culicis]